MSEANVALRFVADGVVEPATGTRRVINLENVESSTGRLIGVDADPVSPGVNAFAPGDVLFGKLRPYLAKSYLVDEKLEGSSEFLVLRPRQTLDSRFLYRTTQSHAWLEFAAMTSDGAKMPRTSWSALAEFKLALPSLDQQRRIADFLDDQVARIDNIIAARRAQEARSKEQYLASLDHALQSDRNRPLATLSDPRRPIQYGIVLPGPDFPGGVKIVKGGDIASGRVRLGDLNRTDPKIESGYVRSRLKLDDLVISIRGSVGEVDIVTQTAHGANLTQDAARIAALGCDPRWLMAVLKSPCVKSEMRLKTTGAMVPGLNIENLKTIRVPDVDSSTQARQLDECMLAEQAYQRGSQHLARGVALMTDMKRSLITAAVTGEFDVSTADGSQVLV